MEIVRYDDPRAAAPYTGLALYAPHSILNFTILFVVHMSIFLELYLQYGFIKFFNIVVVLNIRVRLNCPVRNDIIVSILGLIYALFIKV